MAMADVNDLADQHHRDGFSRNDSPLRKWTRLNNTSKMKYIVVTWIIPLRPFGCSRI